MTASAGWSGRYYQSSVAMPDGSIVLMGGRDRSGGLKNDVWRSTDNGATWTVVTASAGWTVREAHSSVAMPDGSIVLMGGYWPKNDVWRSTDNGATWTQVNASAGWSERSDFSSVVMPDGSIVLMGSWENGGNKNDVWRFMPAGSPAQNPSHTYTTPGIYPVALQAYNTGGYNSTRKTGYITVTRAPAPILTPEPYDSGGENRAGIYESPSQKGAQETQPGTTSAPPVPSTTPNTANPPSVKLPVSAGTTDIGMVAWLLGIIQHNPVVVVIVIGGVGAVVYFGVWKRRIKFWERLFQLFSEFLHSVLMQDFYVFFNVVDEMDEKMLYK
jgi:hypothetical protein